MRSVPSVTTGSEVRWRLAKMLEQAMLYAKESGDKEPLKQAFKLCRGAMEEFKIDANMGRLDRDYLEALRMALEKAERKVK